MRKTKSLPISRDELTVLQCSRTNARDVYDNLLASLDLLLTGLFRQFTHSGHRNETNVATFIYIVYNCDATF